MCWCRWPARTGIPHGGVQQVHGRPAQAQSVHPVRGLFEIRHHARGTEGGGPESGRTGRCRSPGARRLHRKKQLSLEITENISCYYIIQPNKTQVPVSEDAFQMQAYKIYTNKL